MKKATPIQAVFFDVGNTLLFPCPSVAETFTKIARQRGHALEVAEVEKHMPAMEEYYAAEYMRDGDFWCSPEGALAIWMDQYRYVSHLAGIGHDAEEMAAGVHACYRGAAGWSLYPEVHESLRALKARGMALGVVSNWDAGLEDTLRGLGLLPYFDVVVASAAVGYRKPNPVIFCLACEQMNLAPSQVVHVGDLPDADGDGAAAAGLRPIIIDRHHAESACVYERIGSLTELAELLV